VYNTLSSYVMILEIMKPRDWTCQNLLCSVLPV